MANLASKMSGLAKILSVVVVIAVVAALAMVAMRGQDQKYLTATFPRTISLYQGSDVKILGVPVGKVDSVTPTGTDVTVKMSYDSKYKVPSNAKAVIVSPAIVGDRFVQLTPVYRHGPVLQNDARLGEQRTAAPLELDQIYSSIDQLNTALGPQGANKHGALTHLLDSTAKNFAGQGAQFHQTIKNFGKLTGTLAHNKGALFGTARQLGRFVAALAKNDQSVRRFNDSLTSAAGLLKGERGDLSAALHNLGIAMQKVSSFVRENRGSLSRNIKGLNQVVQILVKQRKALNETLSVAPLALTNLFHTYNPSSGTLDTRANMGENINQLSNNPALVLCGILHQAGKGKQSCDAVKQALSGMKRTAPLGEGSTPSQTVDVEHIDRSLAGIVEVKNK
jgi:phospholipid/cholesterol/gamma-HCH transport system substrate-binding protein